MIPFEIWTIFRCQLLLHHKFFKMKQLSILGCGWLGLPLAKSFIERGWAVNGSTTSEDKIEVLKEVGIIPFKIELSVTQVSGNFSDFLEGSEILIINIPPQVKTSEGPFLEKMKVLMPEIQKSTISKLLFVSSTSVYSDKNELVTEDTPRIATTESGKQLVETEDYLQNLDFLQTTILRFGGLIGAGRNPAKYLSGREGIENPNAAVNLIDQQDCIGIIQAIIDNDAWNTSFNAATPDHPTKEDYYTRKTFESNLEPPSFDYSKPSMGKIISSDKLQKELNYRFKTIKL